MEPKPIVKTAHISGILLMNSYNTDIFFSNYYNLQSVHVEFDQLLSISLIFHNRFHVKISSVYFFFALL